LAPGKLSGLGRMLPNAAVLLRPFIRREALASSRIEGTWAEFEQLIMVEAFPGRDIDNPDIQEVTNYILALETGWRRPPERPISPGFMMELHQQLMSGVRGQTRNPGQRRSGREALRAQYRPRNSGNILNIVDALFESPAITVHQAMVVTQLHYSQASSLVRSLQDDGVLVNPSERKRNSVYLAPAILQAIVGREEHVPLIDTPGAR